MTVGAIVLALVIVAAVMEIHRSGGRGSHSATSTSTHSPRGAAPAGDGQAPHSPSAALTPPSRSATGLPLGQPTLALNLANPQRNPVHLAFKRPPRAGLLFNLDTGRVLWQRNPLVRLRIASLTKMMTALLTVKADAADAPVLITKEAVQTPGSKVGVLPAGRHVSARTLLYGLLLPSGNDAAMALAHQIAGSIPRFVSRMNTEAAHLGLGCTRYSSPSGYVDQGNYSCAADLAVLAHVDLAQPRIAQVVRTSSAILPLPIKGGKIYLYNNNPLLRYGYPGVTGMKTGYTEAAGKCLVITAQRDGVRLGLVLLDSGNPATQARQLLDRAFQGVYRQPAVTEPPIPASQ
jgi:D-alanyl-D-alanine carboxypeptidase (penicillin-binding protein 5/6)